MFRRRRSISTGNWIAFAKASNIPELKKTTRDELIMTNL